MNKLSHETYGGKITYGSKYATAHMIPTPTCRLTWWTKVFVPRIKPFDALDEEDVEGLFWFWSAAIPLRGKELERWGGSEGHNEGRQTSITDRNAVWTKIMLPVRKDRGARLYLYYGQPVLWSLSWAATLIWSLSLPLLWLPPMDINDLHPPDDYSHRFFIWHEWIQVRLFKL